MLPTIFLPPHELSNMYDTSLLRMLITKAHRKVVGIDGNFEDTPLRVSKSLEAERVPLKTLSL